MSYSRFLSNFTGSLPSAIDILSTRTYSTAGTVNGSTPYGASYFTIGNVLVQFTDASNTADVIGNFASTGAKTITFPVAFNDVPWCIVVSPSSNGQNSGQFTVITDSFTTQAFNVFVVSAGTGFTYIAIGPAIPVL